jgi:hypothetical protein
MGLAHSSIDRLRERIGSLRAHLAQMPAASVAEGTRRFEEALFALGQKALGLVRTWLAARPLAARDLAPELLARFKSKTGRVVAYVTPRGSIWDVAFLDRFVGRLKSVTPRVTGFPITHQIYSRMVVRGFKQAMVYAFVAVVVLLALDFRRVRPVLRLVHSKGVFPRRRTLPPPRSPPPGRPGRGLRRESGGWRRGGKGGATSLGVVYPSTASPGSSLS